MMRADAYIIFGQPNAGKSTLLNALVGEALAPVHHRAQMTRKSLLGIFTKNDFQCLFWDTPGWHESDKPLNREIITQLESKIRQTQSGLLVLIDVTQTLPENFLEKTHKLKAEKKIIVLNKCDTPQNEWKIDVTIIEKWAQEQLYPVYKISAKTKAGLSSLTDYLQTVAPEHPFYFSEDEMTSESLRELAALRIQETLMDVLAEEIPYECAVMIESYKESVREDKIAAVIIVNRDSQKGIVIGHKATMVKRIRQESQKKLKKFLGKDVKIEIFVRVEAGWVKNPAKIREYLGIST